MPRLTPAAHLLLYRAAIRERADRMALVELMIQPAKPGIAPERPRIGPTPLPAVNTHKPGRTRQNRSSRK